MTRSRHAAARGRHEPPGPRRQARHRATAGRGTHRRDRFGHHRYLVSALTVAGLIAGVGVGVLVRADEAGSGEAVVAAARPAPPTTAAPRTSPRPATTTPGSAAKHTRAGPTADGRRDGGDHESEPHLPDVEHRVDKAMSIARAHHLRAAVTVLDTRDGTSHVGGTAHARFATASIVKVLIAAELLDTGQMHGTTATLANAMVTRSDDDAADVLWGLAGGPDLEPWIAEHYGIADLGAPNIQPGFWGNTQVTASGFARLLAALKHDPAVWPWLGHALEHTARFAADGTDQEFGLLAADPQAEVKQGWARQSADHVGDSVLNTVGYVDHARFVVVVLTEGAAGDDVDDTGFNAEQAATTTSMAEALLPLTGDVTGR